MQEEYGMREAMHGLSQIDLRTQEVRDMEVARRLQEEELMVPQHFYTNGRRSISTDSHSLPCFSVVQASRPDKRAAQVAQDEVSRRFSTSQSRAPSAQAFQGLNQSD